MISTFSTLGNYDYGFYWHFHLDGEIELEVKLTRMLSVGGIPATGVGVDPEFAPHKPCRLFSQCSKAYC